MDRDGIEFRSGSMKVPLSYLGSVAVEAGVKIPTDSVVVAKAADGTKLVLAEFVSHDGEKNGLRARRYAQILQDMINEAKALQALVDQTEDEDVQHHP